MASQQEEAAKLRNDAIHEIRHGSKEKGHQWLEQVVEINPNDEHAWLWLSSVAPDDEARRFCLNRVLSINPDSEAAKRGLAKLPAPPLPTPPAPSPQTWQTLPAQPWQEQPQQWPQSSVQSVAPPVSGNDQRFSIGLLGALVLAAGCFTPIVSAPVVGTVTYFSGGSGDGVIALVFAFLAFLIVLMRRYKALLAPALLSGGMLVYDFINVSLALERLSDELEGNIFAALAGGAHMQWGWLPLFGGVLLLFIAALSRGSAVAPPLSLLSKVLAGALMACAVGVVGLALYDSATTQRPAASPFRQPGSIQPRSTEHFVIYRITGTATSTDLTYELPLGSQQEQRRPVPWEKSFTASTGEFLYISAQNRGEYGTVRCQIMVDGRTIQDAESKGGYTIASCSGSAR